MGRPSAFDPAVCALVEDYCLLGATIDELAELLGVNDGTIALWRKERPEFDAAIRAGGARADARVARSLFRRAVGWEHEAVHISAYQGEVTMTPYIERFPADTTACLAWLQNRRRQDWKMQRRGEDDADLTPEEFADAANRVIQAAMAVAASPDPVDPNVPLQNGRQS